MPQLNFKSSSIQSDWITYQVDILNRFVLLPQCLGGDHTQELNVTGPAKGKIKGLTIRGTVWMTSPIKQSPHVLMLQYSMAPLKTEKNDHLALQHVKQSHSSSDENKDAPNTETEKNE